MIKITYFRNSEKLKEIHNIFPKHKQEKTEETYIKTLNERKTHFCKIWEEIEKEKKLKKESDLKKEKIEKKIESKKKIELLSEKYRPLNFHELIGNDYLNKEIMKWMKKWRDFKKSSSSSNFIKNEKDEKEEIILKPAVFWGPSGTGKSTFARIIAKIFNYKLFVINASSERNGKKLLEKINNIGTTQNILSNWKKNNNDISDQNLDKEKYKDILIVLDEVDGTINSEKNSAIKFLLDNIIDDRSNKLLIKKPIIFICNNVYIKGLKKLRNVSDLFNFKREKENLLERVLEILEKEKKYIPRNIVEKIIDNFNWDVRAVLNFLQVILMQKDFTEKKIIKSLRNFNDDNRNYFEIMKVIFFNSSYKKLNFRYQEDSVFSGVFENYLNSTNLVILKDINSALDVFTFNDKLQHKQNKMGGGFFFNKYAYSIVQYIFHFLRQKKFFMTKFFTEEINFKWSNREKKNILFSFFEDFNFSVEKNFSYLDIFYKMLNVKFLSANLSKVQKKILNTIVKILIKMDIKVIEENKPIYENNFNIKKKNNEEIEERKPYFMNKKEKIIRFEPNISSFFIYNDKNYSFNYTQQTSAVINLNYNRIKNFKVKNKETEKEKNNNIFAFKKKKIFCPDDKFGVLYKFHESSLSGVAYDVDFDFFKFN